VSASHLASHIPYAFVATIGHHARLLIPAHARLLTEDAVETSAMR
jgi:hypothetical protein